LERWPSLARAVRANASRCFRAWRESGEQILAAISETTAISGALAKGSLSGWPSSRGNGPRSLLLQA
jgi:hypothetical protein